MEAHERQYQHRKRLLRELNRKAKLLLSRKEVNYLYGSLKEYQAYRQVRPNLHWGPIHTRRGTRCVRKFEHFSFDVA